MIKDAKFHEMRMKVPGEWGMEDFFVGNVPTAPESKSMANEIEKVRRKRNRYVEV